MATSEKVRSVAVLPPALGTPKTDVPLCQFPVTRAPNPFLKIPPGLQPHAADARRDYPLPSRRADRAPAPPPDQDLVPETPAVVEAELKAATLAATEASAAESAEASAAETTAASRSALPAFSLSRAGLAWRRCGGASRRRRHGACSRHLACNRFAAPLSPALGKGAARRPRRGDRLGEIDAPPHFLAVRPLEIHRPGVDAQEAPVVAAEEALEKAASISGVAVGKNAIAPRIRVLV